MQCTHIIYVLVMIHICRLCFYVMVMHSTLVIKIQILRILNHCVPTPPPAPHPLLLPSPPTPLFN